MMCLFFAGTSFFLVVDFPFEIVEIGFTDPPEYALGIIGITADPLLLTGENLLAGLGIKGGELQPDPGRRLIVSGMYHRVLYPMVCRIGMSIAVPVGFLLIAGFPGYLRLNMPRIQR